MATLSSAAAARWITAHNLFPVSDGRVVRAAQRGEIPAGLVGKRYRVHETDLIEVAQHFARIDASRTVAARLSAEKSARRLARAERINAST